MDDGLFLAVSLGMLSGLYNLVIVTDIVIVPDIVIAAAFCVTVSSILFHYHRYLV